MEDGNCLSCLIFGDKATFHINGKVDCHNVQIWGFENPHEILNITMIF